MIDSRQKILGFFTLAIATVARNSAASRVAKGTPNYDVPCVLLARLAVDGSDVHHGFEPSPTDPLHLLILLKDIERFFRGE